MEQRKLARIAEETQMQADAPQKAAPTESPQTQAAPSEASATPAVTTSAALPPVTATEPQPAASAAATTPAPAPAPQAVPTDRLLLREGDAVRVSFPGAPNLNKVQQIRRDGKITLDLVGEVQAAGLTTAELEKKLLDLYGPQLQTKEVTVSLESSAFPVYVTGAVLRPGKVLFDRPVTALEAIMEAGGFDMARANMKKVRVIRQERGGQPQHFLLNLKAVMDGKAAEQFTLKPSDIIYVPERFTWF